MHQRLNEVNKVIISLQLNMLGKKMTKTELYVLHATSVLLAVVFKTISALKEYPENGLNLEACSDEFNLKVARKRN